MQNVLAMKVIAPVEKLMVMEFHREMQNALAVIGRWKFVDCPSVDSGVAADFD